MVKKNEECDTRETKTIEYFNPLDFVYSLKKAVIRAPVLIIPIFLISSIIIGFSVIILISLYIMISEKISKIINKSKD
jgi:hypothetical protein